MQIPAFFLLLLLTATAARAASGDLLMSMDLPGNDLETVLAPDAEYCQLICTHHPFCTFFTFLTNDSNANETRFYCNLKYNANRNPGTPVPQENAVSGYALAKDEINLHRCFPKLFPNLNFTGNDFKKVSANNLTACRDMCTASLDCQFFSYTKSPGTGSQCFLKFQAKIPSPPSIVTTSGMMSGFSQKDCCSGVACTQDCADLFVPSVEFQGTNVTEVQASDVVSCQSACTKNPYCHFFTFHTKDWSLDQSALTCYLKKSVSGIPSGISSSPNVLSGFTKKSSEFNKSEKDCAHFLLPDFDFPGGDIDYILASDALHCQRICTQHPRCQFFTYSNDQSPVNRKFSCNLKQSDTKIPISITPLPNVVSGFSLTSAGVQRGGKECANLLLPSVDFNGEDIVKTTASDVSKCQALCTSHAQCQFFTYVPSTASCLHKGNAVGIPTTPLISDTVISGFALRSSGVQKGSKGCSDFVLPGFNFGGDDIEKVPAVDAKYCQLLCTYHPRCRFFTYYPMERTSSSWRFACFLKGRTFNLPPSVSSNSGCVSGFPYSYHGTQKPCIPQAYTNIDFNGYGERTLRTASFELCRDACTQDPSCQFFTYATAYYAVAAVQGTCFPKNVMSLPNPDVLDLVPNVTSGFPLRKCEGDIEGYVPPLAAEIPDSTCVLA